jgi:glycosyltransferase involved in cell wall biosynthesis
LVLGDQLAVEYADRLRIAPDRISVLPNAVMVNVPVVVQDGANPVHAVAVGRLGERKGSYDIVEAVAQLPPKVRRRLRVTLAGDGDVDGVTAAVGVAGVGDTVRVVGWLEPPQLKVLLEGAHIFLLPSYEEAMPMALLEAMARGLAPVTTPVGSIPEVVTDGVDALLVTPGRPDEIALALVRLVSNERLRLWIGAAARWRSRGFRSERWYARLSALWTRLADDGQRPRSESPKASLRCGRC